MEIHRELAALVARAGTDVLEDERDFRAAFDDFIAETAVTEGDVNLLADAIRLGALRRVVDHVRHGADPRITVAVQSERMAAQRGTHEATGARWALGVLLFACGGIDEAGLAALLGERGSRAASRGTVPPETVLPPTVLPGTVLPGTVRGETVRGETVRGETVRGETPQRTTAHLPRTRRQVGATTHASSAPTARRRRGWVLIAAAAVLLGLAGGTTYVVLDEAPGTARRGTPSAVRPDADRATPTPELAAGAVVTVDGLRLPAPSDRLAMGGRRGGVTVSALATLDAVPTADGERRAPFRHRLVAFTLAPGPCQVRRCRAWQRLDLRVRVGDRILELPSGGPTFAVAVPTDTPVALQYDADGFDQRIDLATGRPTGSNIVVLARGRRSVVLGSERGVRITADRLLAAGQGRWTARVDGARLFFFTGRAGLRDPDRAYLEIEVTHRRPGRSGVFLFEPGEVRLLGPRGESYPQRDLDPDTPDHPVFVVPGTFTRGTLVLGGSHEEASDRGRIRLTVHRTTFRVRIPQ